MTSFTDYLSHGNAWLFVPVAIILGVLHGFEPGHSKTMMAAFIIAIRGTVPQALLLGISATISHTAIIWILAGIGLYYAKEIDIEEVEPYFQMVTGLIVVGMAAWMFIRTRKEEQERIEHEQARVRFHPGEQSRSESGEADSSHSRAVPDILILPSGVASPHGHGQFQEHDHSHSHPMPGSLILPAGMAAPVGHGRGRGPHGGQMVDTGHGWLEVAVFQTGVSPRLRIYPCKASGQPVPVPKGTTMRVETARLDGSSQTFVFEAKDGYWDATSELREPHEFLAIVTMSHGDHSHTYRLRFTGGDEHDPDDLPAEVPEPEKTEYEDAHQRAHAEEIKERFTSRQVTTWQVILFGLTGGLLPCGAALTVLLMCLQARQIFLGMMIVLAFSIGLALTLVSFGAVAALSVRAATRRFQGFDNLARKLPYASSALMAVIGLVVAAEGVRGIMR
jgi:nickel/cobalt transporter (NicO) family protein